MTTMKSFLNHPYAFWAILSLPAIPILLSLTSGDPKAIEGALHPTGEFAARFMIISMMITPLMMLFKGASWPRWMMKRRRYLGVAAFGYALAHIQPLLIAVNGKTSRHLGASRGGTS